MKAANILNSSLLDIIFENRNKDYGAYPLRKYYHERIYKALGIILLLISLLSVNIMKHKPVMDIANPYVIPDPEYFHPAKLKEEPTQPVAVKPKPAANPHRLNTQLFTAVIKLVDSSEISTKLSNLDSAVISNVNNDTVGDVKQLLKTPLIPGKIAEVRNVFIKSIDKINPVNFAEVNPSFPGGTDALIKFLQKNLQNPQNLDADEIVTVQIKFIVGYDGVLKGFVIVEDGGVAFNNEVIMVLKEMPAWIPGKTAGENISVYYSLPVKFMQ